MYFAKLDDVKELKNVSLDDKLTVLCNMDDTVTVAQMLSLFSLDRKSIIFEETPNLENDTMLTGYILGKASGVKGTSVFITNDETLLAQKKIVIGDTVLCFQKGIKGAKKVADKAEPVKRKRRTKAEIEAEKQSKEKESTAEKAVEYDIDEIMPKPARDETSAPQNTETKRKKNNFSKALNALIKVSEEEENIVRSAFIDSAADFTLEMQLRLKFASSENPSRADEIYKAVKDAYAELKAIV